MLHHTLIDGLFQAVADSVEQAIVHALCLAHPVTGRDGHHRRALADLLRDEAAFFSPASNAP
jgi:D-aminopeptidase